MGDPAPGKGAVLQDFNENIDDHDKRGGHRDAGEDTGHVGDLPRLLDRVADAFTADQKFANKRGADGARHGNLEPGEKERQQRGPDNAARDHRR